MHRPGAEAAGPVLRIDLDAPAQAGAFDARVTVGSTAYEVKDLALDISRSDLTEALLGAKDSSGRTLESAGIDLEVGVGAQDGQWTVSFAALPASAGAVKLETALKRAAEADGGSGSAGTSGSARRSGWDGRRMGKRARKTWEAVDGAVVGRAPQDEWGRGWSRRGKGDVQPRERESPKRGSLAAGGIRGGRVRP